MVRRCSHDERIGSSMRVNFVLLLNRLKQKKIFKCERRVALAVELSKVNLFTV